MSQAPDDRLPRVLMAIDLDPSQKFGTFEEQVAELARAFQTRGSLLLPLFRAPVDAAARSDDDLAASLRGESLDLNRFTPGRFARLLRLIRRERIEVIHWNFYEPLRNPYLWALGAVVPRLCQVYTDHISRYPDVVPTCSGLKAAIKRRLLRQYAAVFCVSDFVFEGLRAQGVWPGLQRVTHFVNTSRFHPDSAARARVRQELGETRPFVAVVVGQLIPEKGIATAIRALAALPDSAALWIVGTGPEASALEALADAQGVAGRVRFLGLRRRVEPYLQAADVFVCPSIWAEAAGLVNIEALASGLPVVASAVGGIPEIVEEGRTGFLVPPGAADPLAARLRLLHDDPATRLAMAASAQAEALARYSAEVVVPDYLEQYRYLRPVSARAAGVGGPG